MTVRRLPLWRWCLTLFTVDDLDPPYEPFLPAMTRRARQSTPKLGTKPKAQAPVSYRNILESRKIDILFVEPIEEEKLISEEIL